MKPPPTAGDLSGSLLVAHPMMADPNFRRAILYLSHHSAADGALGFIINRPLGQNLGDLHIAESFPEAVGVPLYEGGPVHRNQVIVASLEWDASAKECKFEQIPPPESALSLPKPANEKLRVFLGYAGWSKNQLESEIAHNSWLVIHPHPDLLHKDADEMTWLRIMDGLGPLYRTLADAPLDPSRN